ncbi:MAG: hypothetical protein WB994_02500 [Candidatus Acidiferrum sp.]
MAKYFESGGGDIHICEGLAAMIAHATGIKWEEEDAERLNEELNKAVHTAAMPLQEVKIKQSLEDFADHLASVYVYPKRYLPGAHNGFKQAFLTVMRAAEKRANTQAKENLGQDGKAIGNNIPNKPGASRFRVG